MAETKTVLIKIEAQVPAAATSVTIESSVKDAIEAMLNGINIVSIKSEVSDG